MMSPEFKDAMLYLGSAFLIYLIAFTLVEWFLPL